MICALVGSLCGVVHAADRIVVHEWGTFTSLQDETGRALSYINTDDEPVPAFVARAAKTSVLNAPTDMPPPLSQGAPSGHPQVTMRLETPVTYFHLPPSMQRASVDVTVEFRGGWLTEFFPAATALADGKPFPAEGFPKLSEKTVGRLEWKKVQVGGDGKGPTTSEHVWLVPREVKADAVTVDGQSERFLFYRGVAHLDAPIRIIQQSGGDLLEIAGEFPRPAAGGAERPAVVWLVDVRPDGRCAFRPAYSIAAQSNVFRGHAQSTFADADYAPDTSKLHAAMHAALVSEGLFDDEATAMLDTWELSYFKAPGTRVFFTVPQMWTDRVLPLTISQPADVTRVMVGRIELVTPRHRELLKTIAATTPVPNLKEVVWAMAKLRDDAARRDAYNALASGRGDARELGVTVPPVYQAFLELGRFRTALVLDAAAKEKPGGEGMLDFSYEIQMPGTGVAQQRALQRSRGN
jgi:hypothetical protein